MFVVYYYLFIPYQYLPCVRYPAADESFYVCLTDTSRVSFEAANRPNYFLYAGPSGQVRLAKWEENEAYWDRATFVLHRNTWIPGYDSLESHAKPGFFLHATLPRLHLLKYRHFDSFRKATLFRLTGQQHWTAQNWALRVDSGSSVGHHLFSQTSVFPLPACSAQRVASLIPDTKNTAALVLVNGKGAAASSGLDFLLTAFRGTDEVKTLDIYDFLSSSH